MSTGSTRQHTPEGLRRLGNLAELWRARYGRCRNYAEASRIAFDRARAAAQAATADGNADAWHDLAQLLTVWSEGLEKAHADSIAAARTQPRRR